MTQIELMAVVQILRAWQTSPSAPAMDLSGGMFAGRVTPLGADEVEEMKTWLRRVSPTAYRGLFPETEPAYGRGADE